MKRPSGRTRWTAVALAAISFSAVSASAATIVGTDYSDDYSTGTQWNADVFESDNAAWSSNVGGIVQMTSASTGNNDVVGYYTYRFAWPAGGASKTEATITINDWLRGKNAGIRALTSDDNANWTTQLDNYSAGGNSGHGTIPISFTTTVASGQDLYFRIEVYDNPNGSYTDQPSGQVYDIGVSFASVPEPSMVAAMGMVGLLLKRRRGSSRR
jgi:hypothetical protein